MKTKQGRSQIDYLYKVLGNLNTLYPLLSHPILLHQESLIPNFHLKSTLTQYIQTNSAK